jgi:RHS repeat-associated protein
MAYANLDAVTQIAKGLSTTTFSYDNNGNVTQKSVDGTTTTYVYDYANRLTALGVLGATTTYAYDAFGQRVLQTGTTTTYLYPFKWYSVASSTGSGAKYATTTDYVFNGESLVSTIDQQTASGNATGTAKTRYVHPDHLGSTNVVTDENDNVVQTLDYYPYGSLRVSVATSTNERRKYVDRFSDDSGLSYLNARYYDQNRGQFMSEDPTFWSLKMPLNNPQSLNSYSYADDNPITKSDPEGLAATIAQKIQVLQAQIKILQGIISLYLGGATQQGNTALSAYQTAFGGNGQNNAQQGSGSIATWRSNASGGSLQMPNITTSLNVDMRTHAGDPWIVDPFYLRDKVKNGGAWDLKNTPQYSSKTHPLGFIYDGQHISSDAPGNIDYGYVGAAPFWSSPQLLLYEAGKAQQSAGTSQPQWQNEYFHGDDPVDQVNILWGINMYYNR